VLFGHDGVFPLALHRYLRCGGSFSKSLSDDPDSERGFSGSGGLLEASIGPGPVMWFVYSFSCLPLLVI